MARPVKMIDGYSESLMKCEGFEDEVNMALEKTATFLRRL